MAEAIAFKLVCDMHHLQSRMEIMGFLGPALAEQWFAGINVEHSGSEAERKARSELCASMEELVLELVDASEEYEEIVSRRKLALSLHRLWQESRAPTSRQRRRRRTERQSERGGGRANKPVPKDVNNEPGKWMALFSLVELRNNFEEQVNALTSLLMGCLTAGEREEEEMALFGEVKKDQLCTVPPAIQREPPPR